MLAVASSAQTGTKHKILLLVTALLYWWTLGLTQITIQINLLHFQQR